MLLSRHHHHRALAMANQGRHTEAEKKHRAVLAIQERMLGPEHPGSSASRSGMAIALHAQGRHVEAEKELRALLAIRERVLGPGHPDSLASRNNLAYCLSVQKKTREALENRGQASYLDRLSAQPHLRWRHKERISNAQWRVRTKGATYRC
jgi:hypothetical protein